MMLRYAVCLAALTCFSGLQAQTAPARIVDNNSHAWLIYMGDHPFGDSKWGLHFEEQWRREDMGLTPQQNLLRTGVNYRFNPNIAATVGYGYITTHRYGQHPVGAPFTEHRIYEQALITNKIGRVTINNRHRLEQREIGEVRVNPGGVRERYNWRHENRYRYMFQVMTPIKGRYGISAYDEIMVNFGSNVAANVFDQNRAYGALYVQLPKKTRVEVGYLNQLVQQRNGRIFESNHTLVITVFNTLSFGGKS